MRVMVTGGAGYIGSIVSEQLVADGHEVLIYDNLSKGHRDAVPEGAVLDVGDVRDGDRLRLLFRRYETDAVVHMAAASLVGESVERPGHYYQQNVEAGLNLLDAMRESRVMRLVFSSTAAVYGEPAKQPIEETAPTCPTNPYGETKLAFERALPWFARAYGLRWISLRYFNAAGASARNGERHDPETHLIPLILEVAAGKRAEVTVYGNDYPTADGTCIRDYIHVLDLADAHVRALRALADTSAGRIYNLGCGGAGYSVREVIDAAARVTGMTIPVRVGPRRAGDPAVLVASSARIVSELGWRPSHQSLEEIIGSAWKWLGASSSSAAVSAA